MTNHTKAGLTVVSVWMGVAMFVYLAAYHILVLFGLMGLAVVVVMSGIIYTGVLDNLKKGAR